MQEETFYKHNRETTFTKDYTLCGKVVVSDTPSFVEGYMGGEQGTQYELHIGAYVFRNDEQFVKKVGIEKSTKEATEDPLLVIKLGSDYSLKTFLDFSKTLVPRKAVKKKVFISTTIV